MDLAVDDRSERSGWRLTHRRPRNRIRFGLSPEVALGITRTCPTSGKFRAGFGSEDFPG
jgi:hypothetical protein